MKGTIINFRKGVDHQYNKHMVIEAEGTDSRDKAEKLVGKEATFKTPSGKEIKGKVKSAHGNKGALRVIFDTGMPGQSIGKPVEIKS